MNYITENETTKILEITDKMVVYHCSVRLIKETTKMGNTWLVPVEGRYRSSKVKDGENK